MTVPVGVLFYCTPFSKTALISDLREAFTVVETAADKFCCAFGDREILQLDTAYKHSVTDDLTAISNGFKLLTFSKRLFTDCCHRCGNGKGFDSCTCKGRLCYLGHFRRNCNFSQSIKILMHQIFINVRYETISLDGSERCRKSGCFQIVAVLESIFTNRCDAF